MKSIVSWICLIVLLFLAAVPLAAASVPPSIVSQTAAVMEVTTGQLLYDKGADTPMYPASITKIMTVAMALEKANGDLSDEITLTEEAIWDERFMDRSSTHIALDVGEVITVEQAAYATMVQSANDAANALGLYISGTLEQFVTDVNLKLSEIGCTHTHFANPNGLPNEEHITTARDMVQITRWALTIPRFREIFGAYSYTMEPTNKQPEERRMGTDHMMFVDSAYTYDGAWGGKLGWTQDAQHTAVTAAKRGDLELICVVMRSENKYDKFKDTTALFDYVFGNFKLLAVPLSGLEQTSIPMVNEAGAQVGQVEIDPDQTLSLVVPQALAAEAVTVQYDLPESYLAGGTIQPTATLSYTDGGETLSVGPLELVYETIRPTDLISASTQQPDGEGDLLATLLGILKIAGIVLLVLFILLVLLVFIVRAINLSRRKRRRQQRALERRRQQQARPYQPQHARPNLTVRYGPREDDAQK